MVTGTICLLLLIVFSLSLWISAYAAAFFLLGGSLKDAVNVCLRQLDDWQLAVAICRVVEGSDQGPILRFVLESKIIPLAFQGGHRWLGTWAFWLLGRRDLAVRILVVSHLLASHPLLLALILLGLVPSKAKLTMSL